MQSQSSFISILLASKELIDFFQSPPEHCRTASLGRVPSHYTCPATKALPDWNAPDKPWRASRFEMNAMSLWERMLFKHVPLNTSSSLHSAGAPPRAKTTEHNLLKIHRASLRPCILISIMIVTLFTWVFCRQMYSVFPKIMESVFLTSLLPCEVVGT